MAMRIMLLLILQLIIKFLPAQLCLYKTDKDVSKYLNAKKEWEYQIINLFNPIENKDTFCAEIWTYELQYPDGSTKIKGTLKNGLWHGKWRIYSPQGIKIFEGVFRDGKAQNNLQYFYNNGSLSYYQDYSNKMRINEFKLNRNGDTSFYGIWDTIGKFSYFKILNEDYYEKFYSDDTINGILLEKYNIKSNQLIEKGYLQNGYKVGEWIYYDAAGNEIKRKIHSKLSKTLYYKEYLEGIYYKGGKYEYYKFFWENLSYPLYSKQHNYFHYAGIGFYVKENGELEVLHFPISELFTEFSAEAFRVISIMPNWEPLERTNDVSKFPLYIFMNFKFF